MLVDITANPGVVQFKLSTMEVHSFLPPSLMGNMKLGDTSQRSFLQWGKKKKRIGCSEYVLGKEGPYRSMSIGRKMEFFLALPFCWEFC
jgi:hypothetical protein